MSRHRAGVLSGSAGVLFASLVLASAGAAAQSVRTAPAGTAGPALPAVPDDLKQGTPANERDYRSLTNTRRSFTNFNVEVVRGMVAEGINEDLDIYALNAYASTVVHHVDGTGQPLDRFRTLSNPVSLALYDGDLLVVGQGNHALARHDLPSGDITDVLMLRSEPADIAVDLDNDWAWISCMGDDSVVQVDLTPPMSVIKVWNAADGLLLKRPRFLHLDPGNLADPDDNQLYVAPMVSGNNTLVLTLDPNDPDDLGVVDGKLLPGTPPGLPDNDLFRISTAPDQVEAVVRAAGSLIMGHGINPLTGDYWVLNVDHNNVSPGMLSEPAVRGMFADNALSITSAAVFSAGGSPPPEPTSIIDLDDFDVITPGPQYQSDRSLSFPYALAFVEDGTGRAAIASSTTPLVVMLDSAGLRVSEFELDDPASAQRGSVARSILFHNGVMLVYCQQTSNILVFRPNSPELGVLTELSLGDDPTPEPVARGRATWYDARPSLDGRTSCNSCHPQGGADALVWSISNEPVDEKGTMVTQPLLGIEDSGPYHWRGERSLADFNVAFPGLLGAASKLDEQNGELDEFLEFVFSLVPPANALQTGPVALDAVGRLELDFDRKLKDALMPYLQGQGLVPRGNFTSPPTPGRPSLGDTVYHDIASLGQRSCEDCHSDPTGTNSEFISDAANAISSESNMKVAHLDNALTLKNQPIVDVDVPGGPAIQRNLLGSGTSHRGDRINLFDFNLRFPLTDSETFDLTAFVQMFDSGTAPSIHYAVQLNALSPPGTTTDIRRWLLRQAARDWVGCVVVGRYPDSLGTLTRMHWYYDPELQRFVPEDQSFSPPVQLGAFTSFDEHPGLDNVFMGVPPGNEERLGADFDADGLDTGGELAEGTDPWNPDSDSDGWLDGYEVAQGGDPDQAGVLPSDQVPPALAGGVSIDFVNATLVKFMFETDEPASWEITTGTPDGPRVTEGRLSLDTRHTAVVQGLWPSTTGSTIPQDKVNSYTSVLVLTDLSGNQSEPLPMPNFATASLLHGGGLNNNVIGRLEALNEVRTATTYAATASIRVDFKEQGPPAIPADERIVVAQLLKQAPNGQDWVIVPAIDIVHDAPATDFIFGMQQTFYGTTPGLLPGPFLVLSPTPVAGTASVNFTVQNLGATQNVMFNILAVIPEPAGYDELNPAFPPNMRTLTNYQIQATANENRGFVSSL